jgi:tripartite-type tricarboxylate transporter receptor subunit TctC
MDGGPGMRTAEEGDMVVSKIGVLAVAGVLAGASMLAAGAAQAADFKGKSIAMVIGSEPGGGTDNSGRLFAPFLEKYLPGNPSVVVRNMPGAQGITALTYVVQQTKPDGLTLITASSQQANPLTYRRAPGVGYDPTTFRYVGGVGRGGTVVLISKEAETRLYDKTAKQVFLGAVDGIRSGEQVAIWGAEYLGWNIKWIIGYRGTSASTLALESGEIDMFTTGTLAQIKRLTESGKFKILNQTGVLENGKWTGRPEFGDAPYFQVLMEGKISDPVAQQAYRHWESVNALDKWSALIGGTPDDIVDAYREAFTKMYADPQFMERGLKVSDDLTPMSYQTVETLVSQLVSNTTEEAEQYIKGVLRKHGMRVE